MTPREYRDYCSPLGRPTQHAEAWVGETQGNWRADANEATADAFEALVLMPWVSAIAVGAFWFGVLRGMRR